MIRIQKQSRRLYLSLSVKKYGKVIVAIALPIHYLGICQWEVLFGESEECT